MAELGASKLDDSNGEFDMNFPFCFVIISPPLITQNQPDRRTKKRVFSASVESEERGSLTLNGTVASIMKNVYAMR